ncbi:MAG: HAMP domain-containing histidine kinase [Trueperaceae bacterium]|nr:HAMP domain-containing histidine kinase [Trueperaceae bacterium]
MNRLFTRIILAMVIVSAVSLIVIPLSQLVALKRASGGFAQDFRALVEERTQPPPFYRFGPPPTKLDKDNETFTTVPEDGETNRNHRPPFAPDGTEIQTRASALQDLNLRLFDYLSSYRAAQRRGIVVGISIAILGCVLLSLWLARSLARPLEAVSLAANTLARGNLAARVALQNEKTQPKETRDLAQNFNTMAASLEQLEGERKAMIADIAHELRNPIASMQFRLDALSDGLIDFNEDESELLKGQLGLLSRLIEDLRTLSLADAGQLSLTMERLELYPLLERILEHQKQKALRSNVNLSLEAQSQPLVKGDAHRLTQVITNLLDNAFKVMPDGGEIRLHLSTEQDNAVIEVFDTGPGLPEEQLETLFDRFVSGQRRDTQGKEGSGLGLAIVKTLVGLHGGEVKAANYDKGAVFSIYLPRLEVK